MKYAKREVCLVDDLGVEWVRASLTAPAVKRIIRLYQAQEVWLSERITA